MTKKPAKKINSKSQAKPNLKGLLKTIDLNFDILHGEIKLLRSSMVKLHGKINRLDKTSGDGFGEVKKELTDIKTEVKKIQKVSRYGDMYENMLTVVGK